MHCHPAKKGQKPSHTGCAAAAACNHSTQISLIAPLPRAVIAPAASMEAPIEGRTAHLVIESQLICGFLAPPFNPPRSRA